MLFLSDLSSIKKRTQQVFFILPLIPLYVTLRLSLLFLCMFILPWCTRATTGESRMTILAKILTAIFLLFFFLPAPSKADIISVKLRFDNRHIILFSEFEFSQAGYVSFGISSVSFTSTSSRQPDPSRIGFVLQSHELQNQHPLEFAPWISN